MFILFAVLSGFSIGVLWEIYEVLIAWGLYDEVVIKPIIFLKEDYFFDTITDIMADTTGAFMSSLYFLYTRFTTSSRE